MIDVDVNEPFTNSPTIAEYFVFKWILFKYENVSLQYLFFHFSQEISARE